MGCQHEMSRKSIWVNIAAVFTNHCTPITSFQEEKSFFKPQKYKPTLHPMSRKSDGPCIYVLLFTHSYRYYQYHLGGVIKSLPVWTLAYFAPWPYYKMFAKCSIQPGNHLQKVWLPGLLRLGKRSLVAVRWCPGEGSRSTR